MRMIASITGTAALISSAITQVVLAQTLPPVPDKMAVGPAVGVSAPRGAVVLRPCDDINRAVQLHPAGTKYFLKPGLYRLQQIFPKDRDSFIGAQGATLNGARQLNKFEVSGRLYVARNQPPHPKAERVGMCTPQYPRCNRPYDLYFDGRPLRAVSRLSAVGPGTWYFDERRNDVYFHDTPEGHSIELSYMPFAFGGSARDVTISNLIVENYASANQQGAINNHGAGTGWMVLHNEVRWNHGYGIVMGTANKLLGNNVHHNGQLGFGGGSGTHDGLAKGNEVAFNSWNGVNCSWECGGAKWGNVIRLTVAGNYVHHNQGTGLWTDERSSAIVLEDNLIEDNRRAGISHEISHSAVIRDNILRGNGAPDHHWGWRGQIQIQNATDTEVYGNTIVLDPVLGGNGITVIQQDRGREFMPRNISIHHNDITMTGGAGAVIGWFSEVGADGFMHANNHFDYNHYHVSGSATRPVWVANQPGSFAAWQAAGYDPHGTIDAAPTAGRRSRGSLIPEPLRRCRLPVNFRPTSASASRGFPIVRLGLADRRCPSSAVLRQSRCSAPRWRLACGLSFVFSAAGPSGEPLRLPL